MELNNKKIAVTGATGFIGRYIVDKLLEQGAHVVGVVRNPDRVPELKDKGVELRKADLSNVSQLVEGFKGVDAVVANAALFKALNTNWQAHNQANIHGVQNALDAMHQAGVKRLIHISSMAVYSGGPEKIITELRRQFNEQSKKRPWTVYSISKALSEQLAWRLAKEYQIEMTALRPGIVYGAHDENFTLFLKKLFSGAIGVNLIGPAVTMVYAGDVGKAVVLALENNEKSIGKAYNLVGDKPIKISEIKKIWEEAGGPVAAWSLPLWIPSGSSSTTTSIELAKSELGWSNISLLEGFKETFLQENKI